MEAARTIPVLRLGALAPQDRPDARQQFARDERFAEIVVGADLQPDEMVPFLPFVAEEVWDWWQDGSIHRAAWPTSAELREPAAAAGSAASEVATNALVIVRREKSEAKRKLRTAVLEATFSGPEGELALLDQVIDDVTAAGVIHAVNPHGEGATLSVAVELEPEETA